nr:hypothetical protein [uncultured Desulfuromonas sp.]
MRHFLCSLLLISLLLPSTAMAGRRSEIHLQIPAMSATGGSQGGVVVLGKITDLRHFEDRPAVASTPSVAQGGAASLSAEERLYYIARVRDGYGKARNNIFLDPAQPVDQVVRELLTKSLTGLGYKVVDKNSAGKNALRIDVDIDKLWGYIEVKGGGWGGSLPKMAGQIKTVLKVKGPNGSGRYDVSGTALHGFGLMTAGHWVKMFEELFKDYQADLARVRFQ